MDARTCRINVEIVVPTRRTSTWGFKVKYLWLKVFAFHLQYI